MTDAMSASAETDGIIATDERKAPEGETPAGRQKRTFKLSKPIAVGSDELIELTLSEPLLRHQAAVERKKLPSAYVRRIAMIAMLAEVSEEAVGGMAMRDGMTVARWIDQVEGRGIPERSPDVEADADQMPPPLPSAPYVMELLVPIETDGDPITRITLNAPTMRTAVDLEKFKLPAEQAAGLIASLSGQIVPVAMRMALCDVRRVEAWADPFFTPGD